MKKFTLIAACTLATASALAAIPGKKPAQLPLFLQGEKVTVDKNARLNATPSLKTGDINKIRLSKSVADTASDAIPGEDDGPVTITNSAYFRPSGSSFYLGMSPGMYAYSYGTAGLCGIRNSIGFANYTEGASSFRWIVDEIVDIDKDGAPITEAHYFTDKNLALKVTPNMSFYAPGLEAVFDGDTITATSEVSMYHAGGELVDYGYYAGDYPEDGVSFNLYDIYGLSCCAATVYPTFLDDYTINRDWTPTPPADPTQEIYPWETYSSTGANGLWDEYFSSLSEAGYTISPVRVTGLTYVIPQQLSAYLLGNMWFYFESETTEEVILTARIYPINSNGEYDTEKPLGEATATIPAGKYPKSETDPMIIFEFTAMEDGMALAIPPSINQPVAVQVTGLDNEAIRYFSPSLNGTTFLPSDASPEMVQSFWPTHSGLDIAFDYVYTDPDTKETEEGTLETSVVSPLEYGLEDGSLYVPSDFCMYFNIQFPISYDPATGESDYPIVVPATGGDNDITVLAQFNLQVLLDEEYATISGINDDWFTFTTKQIQYPVGDETIPAFQISVNAEELPDGVKGRQGYIVFSGMGCDFVATVTQGEVAGVQKVNVTTQNAPIEYFDLQGRKLSAAPASGIYIQRQGNKAIKRMAH